MEGAGGGWKYHSEDDSLSYVRSDSGISAVRVIKREEFVGSEPDLCTDSPGCSLGRQILDFAENKRAEK